MSCKSLKKPKLGAEIGTEMIQIEVGCDNKRQTFNVHKALLQKHTHPSTRAWPANPEIMAFFSRTRRTPISSA
ncbi:uncharacterized protein RCO7_03553 [Rhynchosporium graminicola]|uniref:BTB domain-containing protein n=1 Tax=Rhynchosporium graminicola TaxID=2792576 RepID=A0A1E1LK72_9HELO|nr:uncharacterized protein RCO7_03553 [Rhynchosporium commune]